MNSNGYNIYKNNSVNYASKEQLLLMLVEGAVKFCKIARQAIVDKDIKKAHDALIRSQDIFSELMVSLDTTQGEWAVQLFRVYDFIISLSNIACLPILQNLTAPSTNISNNCSFDA